ncbi:MAG: imidazoleglycerol-phosphate dehydratase, partial [Candidatus Hadarchaeales archaeon]
MRKAVVKRKTKETEIEVSLNLDGRGKTSIETTIKFFDHLLSSFAKHGAIDLTVRAKGDLSHHIAEDTMIALGEALREALQKKAGIERFGDATVPMDDALVMVAVDLGGRPYAEIEASFRRQKLDDLSTEMIPHLLQTFAASGKLNLHVKVMRGR